MCVSMSEVAFVISATHRILATSMKQNNPLNLDNLPPATDDAVSKQYSLRATACPYNVPYSRL